MKYLPIDKDLFVRNRKKFVEQMDPNSLAILNSNDIYPISADSTMPFQQQRDIFYLSGVDQEESVLVLFPDCPKSKNREILLLKETNDHIAIWEGEKLSKEQGILHAGMLLVMFTASRDVAEHDLAAWQDRALQHSMPIESPAVRHLPVNDRIGNAWCCVAVFPVRHL